MTLWHIAAAAISVGTGLFIAWQGIERAVKLRREWEEEQKLALRLQTEEVKRLEEKQWG